jgi:hypothetical protein
LLQLQAQGRGVGKGVALGLAEAEGFSDIDGNQPRPLTLEEVY